MGEKLIHDVAAATGLPSQLILDELNRLVSASGLSNQNLTLEELRILIADYAQDILAETKDGISPGSPRGR